MNIARQRHNPQIISDQWSQSMQNKLYPSRMLSCPSVDTDLFAVNVIYVYACHAQCYDLTHTYKLEYTYVCRESECGVCIGLCVHDLTFVANVRYTLFSGSLALLRNQDKARMYIHTYVLAYCTYRKFRCNWKGVKLKKKQSGHNACRMMYVLYWHVSQKFWEVCMLKLVINCYSCTFAKIKWIFSVALGRPWTLIDVMDVID